jgi:hypothetical protein
MLNVVILIVFMLNVNECKYEKKITLSVIALTAVMLDAQAREYKSGKYHCTIDLLFDWFEISCMTTDNFCFYLQNRLIQTSQTGGQTVQ